MTPLELENYLKHQIPLTNALGVEVRRAADAEVEIFAPLSPNRNHMGTAFGGSLNAISLLACYTWLFYKLKSRGHDEHIVLKSSRIQYFHPVDSDIRALCKSPDEEKLQKFLKAYDRKGKARIDLTATVWTEKGVACELVGEFVTLGQGD